jgi:thiol-disulfide isomerase/thioredoxin
MKLYALPLLIAAASMAHAELVADVRAALAQNQFPLADQMIRSYRGSMGVTPQMIEALSWMSRGALAAKNLDQADKYAQETYQLSTAELKKRPLDRDPHLPIALGAAIEVEANVLVLRNQRSEAITYLHDQLKTYYSTSIRTRIQKNINLLSMEGKPAPTLEKVSLPKGKPVLIFFWAHWCGDCKGETPILARIKSEYAPRGLALVAPTQKYGYVAGGEDAPPEVELRYIDQVRQKYYAGIIDTPAPVSEENFRRYGASTTPTLVLVDRAGIVRLYHPGTMSYEELHAKVEALFKTPSHYASSAR